MLKLQSLALFVVVLAACSKQTVYEPIRTENEGFAKSPGIALVDYSHIQNPNNPHNLYGVMHNEGMDYVIAQSGAPTIEDITYNDILDYTSEFFVNNAELMDATDIPATAAFLDDILQNWTLEQAYNAAPFSAEQVLFCEQIRAVAVGDDYFNVEDMLAALTQLEDDILSSSMPASEKDLPLAIAALAKHSAYYHSQWLHIPQMTAKRGSDAIADIDPEARRRRWHDLVEADLVGAIVGASAGFFGGFVTGLVGGLFIGGPIGGLALGSSLAVQGSIVGAVTGGVGASLNQVLKPG